MVDLLITNATVVDGTGAPPVVEAVAVIDGRVVARGADAAGPATRTIDASGLALSPGFIDIHTHYDAQVLWDPLCAPSLLHGVTTVIAGNCGLTLAPIVPGDEDFLTRLLAKVEAIPVEAISAGVSFAWKSFADYLDVLEGALALNVGVLVGHSALRRHVMGEAASEGAATDGQIAEMERLLAEGIEAGGLGFSTSTAKAQVDGDGRPTPPKLAERDEFLALAATAGAHVGTSMEFIPLSAMDGFDEGDAALLRDMSRLAHRSINWNALSITPGASDLHLRQLAVSDQAREEGGRVVPLMVPHNARWRMDFGPMNVGLKLVPGCERLFTLGSAELRAALADPAVRAEIAGHVDAVRGGFAQTIVESIERWVLNDTGAAALSGRVGRTVGELAREAGTTPLDTVLDLAVAADLDVGFVRYRYPEDEWTWARRAELLHDDRVVLGASDAGAHVDSIANAEYPTAALKELVRDRPVFRLEELVRLLSAAPAALYGLTDRGVIRPGAVADLVLFDPDTVGPDLLHFGHDFPAGAAHLVSKAKGIEAVLVSGTEVVRGGRPTGALPGRVLRSGRDTHTVAIS